MLQVLPFVEAVVDPPLADMEPVRSTTGWMSSGTELHGEHAWAWVDMPMVLNPSTLRKKVGTAADWSTVTVFALLHGRFGFDPTQLVATETVTPEAGTPVIGFLPPSLTKSSWPERSRWRCSADTGA